MLIVVVTAITITACKKEPAINKKALPEIALTGTRLLADDIALVNDTAYLLEENLIRNANQVLTIEAGTLIKIKNAGIIINVNGKIMAKGTQQVPIVFTPIANKGTAGGMDINNPNRNTVWNGISINGTASTSSGIISYVRIEFAGAGSTAALSLKNVDKATVLNNIQVSYSHSNPVPAFEFSGGDCNAANLVAFACYSIDFSLTNGYTGKLQNLLSYRHPYFAFYSFNNTLAGIYISGNNTFPIISNTTIIGPDEQPESSGVYNGDRSAALIITDKAKFQIRNMVLSGFPKGGLYIDNKESAIALQTGDSDFTYNFVHANDSSRAFYIPAGLIPGIIPPVTAADFKSYMLQPQFYNQFVLNTATYKFTSPYNYDYNPNPMPQAGSPVLTGADFSSPIFSDPFFKPVTYRGALGADNWMSGWVNFKPLQTDYNN